MAERRAAGKSRRLGSSRRKQLYNSSNETPAPAPSPGEEPPWASEIAQRVQELLRERDKEQAGFITRSDMQKLQEEDFPCSTEELELIFDGLDAAGTGRLSTEEFTAGLRQFLSSQKAARDHRRRKTASQRVRLAIPSVMLEGADSEEQRHFAAFMDQLGTDNVSEEQEIWQLWVKLRQDEPQLLGNLEEFLAKMRHRIQEARSKKEVLEKTLNKRVAEHEQEVQQLCETLEQQIQEKRQRLQQESMARSHQHSVELQRALDASEREVQRLVTAQMELETRCRSLRSTEQATSAENRQLEESNRVLEDRLRLLHRQLQQTHERLRTTRATVALEDVEEMGDRAVAELPGEVPLSPQMGPEKSEKHRSEMRIRLGSQSIKPKSTHQVVWEKLPAEISVLGAPRRASSTEEEPFPEFLKEERLSDQSSLLREMNEAIAALSKQLKPPALGAPPAPADAARHPQDDAEPQMEPEADTAHGTTPGGLRETLLGHIGHEVFEGDLKKGPTAAELRAPDVIQAGASVGAGNRRAEEPRAEQGQSPEEAQRMLFLQGKGTGVKELMLEAAEHLQGAPGGSMEAGEQLVEVEGEGWMQEKNGWGKEQLPGGAEEAAVNQGENLQAGVGAPEAGQTGLAAGWQLVRGELGPAVEECVQPSGETPGEEAEPPSGLSQKIEIEPGERLEPKPPSWDEMQMGAAQGDSVLPKVTVAPDPGVLEEECVSVEVHPWGETSDADVLAAPARHGGSSGAGMEDGELEVPQPQGESVTGAAAQGVSAGAEVPPANVQEGRTGTDVQPLEAQGSHASVQLCAEVEAAPQPPDEAGSSGTQPGGSVAPDVQPLEEGDEAELGLGEEMGAAAVHGEGPSPAETPVLTPELGGLFPVKAQALELVGAEESQADTRGDPSPEDPQGGEDGAAMQLGDEAECGGQGQGERGLQQEPVLNLQGAGVGQGEGAGAGVEPQELENQGTDVNGQLIAEVDELKSTPGGSTETDLQQLSEAASLDTEQGGNVAPDVQPLDQVDKPEAVEMVESEDSWADMQLRGGASPETPQGGGIHAAVHLVEEAEDEAQEQGEHGLQQEPELHPHGVTPGHGEGAPGGVQPPEEAESLGRLEDQSTGANVQLLTETDGLKPTAGGNMEADLWLWSETSSLDTEQGGNVAPDVQPLDQVDKPELVEMVQSEDSWAGTQLHGGLSPEGPREGEAGAAVQLGEEAGDGALGQGERELPHEPVLDPQAEGAGAGVQAWEEVVMLDTLEHQSTGVNVQLLTEAEELKSTSGGSTGADVAPLGAAETQEGAQSQSPGLDAGLCAAHTVDMCEGNAGERVSPTAEELPHPERAAAAEGPVLGALTGPNGQILEGTQTLEMLQGERAEAEERPLDGAQGLEGVQGERLEAGARILVETQSLGIKQGHDDGESVLAAPVSKVTLQTSMLKLETMMQEDVLIPDVWQPGASGQVAQSELQEQADNVSLHTVSQQPVKLPHMVEMEQADGPSEHPKQEVPPASTLRIRGQQEGNDQLGMVLGDSSPGGAANSSTQPHQQLLGEQSGDLNFAPRQKQQEVGQNTSQEGKASAGEPGATAAGGAGAAPRGSPEVSLDPDHLFNVLFVGDSHVGKTSFLYRLHADTFNPHLTATVGLDYQVKNLIVDNRRFALRLWDSAGQERYRSITKQFFRKADGVVLMYDITSEYSFSDVRYWLSCIQEGAEDGVAILLLGNKTDCAAERQVPVEEGERLAKEHQLMFYECSAASGHNVSESMVSFIRLLKDHEDKLKNKAEEEPKPPQKKKGCCW
ncbi:ras-related protein Rab-44 [Patagioenas fasciata]|uniref:ras-related protein Rab-44 n=1 Tax=Patagioenas fasciata TaxID=372321 RepID=UPI0032E8C8F0